MSRSCRPVFVLLLLFVSFSGAVSAFEWSATGDHATDPFPLETGVYRLTVSSETNLFAKVVDPAGFMVGSIGVPSMHGGSGSVDIGVTTQGRHTLVVEGHGGAWSAQLTSLASESAIELGNRTAWSGNGDLGSGPIWLGAGVVRLELSSNGAARAQLMDPRGYSVATTWVNTLTGGNTSWYAAIPTDGLYYLNLDGFDSAAWSAFLAPVLWTSAEDASGGLTIEGIKDRASGPFLLPAGILRLVVPAMPALQVVMLDESGSVVWSGASTGVAGGGVTGELAVPGGAYVLNVEGPSMPWSVSLAMTMVTGPLPTITPTLTAPATPPIEPTPPERPGRSFGVRRYVAGGTPADAFGRSPTIGPMIQPSPSRPDGFGRTGWNAAAGSPFTRFVRGYPGARR